MCKGKGKLVITDMKEMNNMAVSIAESFSSGPNNKKKEMAKSMYVTPVDNVSSKIYKGVNKDCAAIMTE